MIDIDNMRTNKPTCLLQIVQMTMQLAQSVTKTTLAVIVTCIQVILVIDMWFVNTQASVQLDGRGGGVVLQGLPQAPSATIPPSSGSKFHLCACASGRLFLVPANTLRCASANEIHNPCS